MTITSVQPTYSTTSSSDTITITGVDSSTLGNYNITSGNVTISSSGSGYAYTPTVVTSAGIASNTIAINSGAVSGGIAIGGAGGYTWSIPEEWDGCFPDWKKVQDMCEQYPALKIALEKFKTTYKLVRDEYDSNNKDS